MENSDADSDESFITDSDEESEHNIYGGGGSDDGSNSGSKESEIDYYGMSRYKLKELYLVIFGKEFSEGNF